MICYLGVGGLEGVALQVLKVELDRVLARLWVVGSHPVDHGQGGVVSGLPQVQAHVVVCPLRHLYPLVANSGFTSEVTARSIRSVVKTWSSVSSKRALVFLAEDERREGGPLLLQELLGDARALISGHLVALPAFSGFPRLVEDAALAVGCGQHHQGTTGDRQHRAHGE